MNGGSGHDGGGPDPASPPERVGRGDDEARLTRRTLSGLQWTGAEKVVSVGLQVVMAAVLARLVSPAAFGLIALGRLVLRFIDYFAKGGLTQALVQKPELTDRDVRAGFWMSVGLGVAATLVVAVAAAPVAALLDAPGLVPVVRLMGVNLALFGFEAVPRALLRRELRFRALAGINVGAYVLGYVGVGLPLALAGGGVSALVAAIVVEAAVSAGASYAVRRHPIRPTLSPRPYRALVGFGGRVSLIGFLEFLGSDVDTLAVGRFAGTGALGVYNRANLLGELPLYHVREVLSNVLFSAFSSVQEDVARLRSAYLSAVATTASLVIPLAAGMAVAARELVLVVLGDDWTGAIPVLPWLLAASAVAMTKHFAGLAAEARAALNRKLLIAGSKVLVLAALLLLARGHALATYGAALAAAAVYGQVAYLLLMTSTLDTGMLELLRPYVPGLITGGVVAAAIAGARLAMGRLGAPLVAVLAAEMAAGALVLAWSLRFGPQSPVRRDVAAWLHRAGMMDRSTPLGPWLRWMLGEPPSETTAGHRLLRDRRGGR